MSRYSAKGADGLDKEDHLINHYSRKRTEMSDPLTPPILLLGPVLTRHYVIGSPMMSPGPAHFSLDNPFTT
jgi:hypothetical protein